MDDFLVRAVLCGLGVAAVAGPLGVFVVWRRMAFFGGTLGHSALLGVAAGLLLGLDTTVGVVAVCVAVALMLVAMEGRLRLGGDTLLGILAHATLALGLVVMAFLTTVRVDLMSYLFGDILAVTPADVMWVMAGGVVVLAALAALWRPLLAVTVHAELAMVEGVPVRTVNTALMLLLAVVVALAIKVVGVLLVVSLLVIPAAAARRFSPTPERMALLAAVAGCLSVAGGLAGSLAWDTPAGPSIVVAAAALFAVSALWPGRAPA